MKFSKEVELYLNGDKFSNGLKVNAAVKESSIINRLEFLERISNGKRIIHIGFADHLPLIRRKIKSNTWLHKRLMNSAKECIGIDIDKEVVKFVREELGVPGIYCLDIIKDEIPGDILEKKWDYLILGEVLEHIDNPVQFLSSIRQKFKMYCERIIITVPNAWDISNINALRKQLEVINSDHRYWFTPYTLAKVGSRAGLLPDEFCTVQNYSVGIRWKKWLLKRFPLLRETVVMIFKL